MENRLLKLLDAEQLSSAKFADAIGVQRSSVSHILSGRNKPSFDFLQKTLKAFPMINADWLIIGKGNMYEGEVNTVSGSLFDQVPVGKVENRADNTDPSAAETNDQSDSISVGDDITAKVDRRPDKLFSEAGTFADEVSHDSDAVNEDVGASDLTDKQVTTSESVGKSSKTISRVIVFYTDKSFESYEKAD